MPLLFMKKILFVITILINFQAISQVHLRNKSTLSNEYAWAKKIVEVENSIWPFNISSIGNSMQSYQQYGYSSAYWHDGLDMRSDAGTHVYSSVAGKVVNIENYYPGNALYWEVAILDDNGYVWKYHHVDHQTIPEKIRQALQNHARIEQGEYIGDIVSWPQSSNGERFHHIHMLVVDGKGRYINPFILLPKLTDTSLPVIREIGLFDSRKKKIKGNSISGKHGIYVNTFDTILHSKFYLTPYMITYKLDGGDEKTVWRFDTLPSLTNDRDYLNDFYLAGTCGNYQCRNFYINLNFDLSTPGNTQFFKLSPGEHQVEVFVYDFVGNVTKQNYLYTVK